MKRIVAFIFVLGLGALVFFASASERYDYDGLEKVCFVTKASALKNDFLQSANLSVVQSGSQVYITVTPDKAKLLREEIKNVDGYVLHFNKDVNLNELKSQFFDFSNNSYKLGDYEIVEGYTSKYDDFRTINGKRFNVQLAATQDEILVGFPFILTGF